MVNQLNRSVRAALAGSLVFGGALTAVVIGGAVPASAAAVIQPITVGTNPFGASSDGTHVWVSNDGSNTVSELNASTGSVI
jgi:DNA-binding beta-propeller fold protein YncE